MAATESSASPRTKTTREERGLQLFLDHGTEIWRIEPHLYRVPSCTSTTVYLVTTRRGQEHCPCPDHEHRGAGCQHLIAARIFRSKSGECASCKGRFLHRDLYEVGPDHLTWFEGDELCSGCAKKSGLS